MAESSTSETKTPASQTDLHNPAPGHTSLHHLLSTLTTTLHPSTFVYITLPSSVQPPPTLVTQLSFHEAEGLTLISTLESAQEHKLEYTFPCRMITLNVHSSLEAVGFLAAVTGRIVEVLGDGSRNGRKGGVGINPVSGFFHDHLFVPAGREEEVLEVLWGLAREAREEEHHRGHGHGH